MVTPYPAVRLKITPKASIRPRVIPHFPSTRDGTAITWEKIGGAWIGNLDYSTVNQATDVAAAARSSTFVLVWDEASDAYVCIPFTMVWSPQPRTVTAAGQIDVLANDIGVAVARTVAEAAVIQLPQISEKIGAVTIYDANGVFATFNQIVTAHAANPTSLLGGSTFLMNQDYQALTFLPHVETGKWLVR